MRMIKDAMRSGRKIVDSGPDFARRRGAPLESLL
jgi:hypothetical protein